MKILIVNNMAPFVWGGAEELAVHLQRNLQAVGHQAEVMRIPFQWEPADRIPSQMLMARTFELWNVDRVIALKFPTYLIRHEHKTLWLLHQFRQAYDLYDAGQSNLADDEQGRTVRALVREADREAFQESRGIFTISPVTRDRLKKYNGFDAHVLRHPLNDPELFPGGASEGYIFAGGRINTMKRQHLLVQALALTPPSVRLVVAGPPDSEEDRLRLERVAEQVGVADRLRLDLRFLPRHEYAKYLNAAAAVAYLPFDEDSLGYVTMEAANAAKPLIAMTDSGGVLDLVQHKETGWRAQPTVESLAQCMTAAVSDPGRTERMGHAVRELWLSMGVNWAATVGALIG